MGGQSRGSEMGHLPGILSKGYFLRSGCFFFLLDMIWSCKVTFAQEHLKGSARHLTNI